MMDTETNPHSLCTLHCSNPARQAVTLAALAAMPDDTPAFFKESSEEILLFVREPELLKQAFKRLSEQVKHFFLPELLLGRPLPEAEHDLMLGDLHLDISQVGSAPYAIFESLNRLINRFASYREALAMEITGDLLLMRQNGVLSEAGTLGHFVGDACQPLKTTSHCDGWNTPQNSNDYRTKSGLHEEFEQLLGTLQPQIQAIGPAQLIHGEQLGEWAMNMIEESNSQVETLYQLEKDGQLRPDHPGPQGIEFAQANLTRAARHLRDIYYWAWTYSAKVAEYEPHDDICDCGCRGRT